MTVWKRRRQGRIDYARYRHGRWPPLALVLRSEWEPIVQLAASCGVANGECPDVALEVFFRYALFRASISSPLAIPSWLRTTAVHVAYHFRTNTIARHETPRNPAELQNVGGVPSAEEELSALEEERELHRLVDGLERDRREVFRRYALQDQPIQVLAAELGIPEATAYNRLRLAREDLQAALRRGDKIQERTKGRRRLGLLSFLFFLRFEAFLRFETLERSFLRFEALERWRRWWNGLVARLPRQGFPGFVRPAFHAFLAFGVAAGVSSIPGGTSVPAAVRSASSPREITAGAVTAPPAAPRAAEHEAVETGTLAAPASAESPAPANKHGERSSPRWPLSLTLAENPPFPVRAAPSEPHPGPLTADRVATVAARAALERGSPREAWMLLRDLDTLFPVAAPSGVAAGIRSDGAKEGN